MACNKINWACGHAGRMQLYGKMAKRESRVACEAGRKCMACWLLEQWENNEDPRFGREDKLELASKIAAGKGIEINA